MLILAVTWLASAKKIILICLWHYCSYQCLFKSLVLVRIWSSGSGSDLQGLESIAQWNQKCVKFGMIMWLSDTLCRGSLCQQVKKYTHLLEVSERSSCQFQVFCRPPQTDKSDVAAAFIQLKMTDDSLLIQQLIINPMNNNTWWWPCGWSRWM